jgi:aldose 1-epimerase
MAQTAEDIVTLRRGPSVVHVAPAVGGAITRYGWEQGEETLEWLRPATSSDIARRVPTGMSCFPLVPFSNRIHEGHFRFQGRSIHLPPNVPSEPHTIHGQGWQSPWTVVNASAEVLTLEYRHRADAWPFPYRARQTFTLSPDVLRVTIEVLNIGDVPMPVGFGLHPYFVRTPKTQATATVSGVWLTGEDAMPTRLSVPPPPDRSLDSGINPDHVALDDNFTGWGRQACIVWPDRHARLTLTGDGPFGFLVVYTPPGEDYVCIEPVSNVINAFNLAAEGRTDTGMIVLSPGERVGGTVVFAPELDYHNV